MLLLLLAFDYYTLFVFPVYYFSYNKLKWLWKKGKYIKILSLSGLLLIASIHDFQTEASFTQLQKLSHWTKA